MSSGVASPVPEAIKPLAISNVGVEEPTRLAIPACAANSSGVNGAIRGATSYTG